MHSVATVVQSKSREICLRYTPRHSIDSHGLCTTQHYYYNTTAANSTTAAAVTGTSPVLLVPLILLTTVTHITNLSLLVLPVFVKLECGPMPNVMVALPNIGGALRSTPQSFADAHY